jgi:hypothetical protein
MASANAVRLALTWLELIVVPEVKVLGIDTAYPMTEMPNTTKTESPTVSTIEKRF